MLGKRILTLSRIEDYQKLASTIYVSGNEA